MKYACIHLISLLIISICFAIITTINHNHQTSLVIKIFLTITISQAVKKLKRGSHRLILIVRKKMQIKIEK